MQLTITITIFIILLLWLYIIFFYNSSKKLPSNRINYYKKLLNEIKEKNISSKEKIITYDKIYHNILTETWYKWSFWEILKKKPTVIKDLNKIWELHKLRNTLVHDLTEQDEKKLGNFEKKYFDEIYSLLKILN